MCKLKSFIVIKPEQQGARPRIVHAHGIDSHSELMEKFGIRERSSSSPHDQPIARVECVPDFAKDLTLDESWTFVLDEQRTPDWWDECKEWAEKECKRICRSLVVASGEIDGEDVIVAENGSVTIKSGRGWAIKGSSVEAWGSSRVVARESSSVEARDSSSVVAWGSSRVEARDSSSVVAWGSSRVVARGSSRVVAWGSSRVEARDSSSVEALESSSVVARDSSSVVARESSSVEARESSRVVAWGSSRVVAWGSSRVVARDSSSVVARESSSVEARESSSVEVKSKYAICARRGAWDGKGYPWTVIPFAE